jgi:plasmid stabilization system protein ParE
MKYRLTLFAKCRLTNILDYINSEFGESIASKLSQKLERDILLLSQNPFLGRKEKLLYFEGSEIISFIEGYYKIQVSQVTSPSFHHFV